MPLVHRHDERAQEGTGGQRIGELLARASIWSGTWASRMGTWQTNCHPTTPKISVPFGECWVVVEAALFGRSAPRLCRMAQKLLASQPAACG